MVNYRYNNHHSTIIHTKVSPNNPSVRSNSITYLVKTKYGLVIERDGQKVDTTQLKKSKKGTKALAKIPNVFYP